MAAGTTTPGTAGLRTGTTTTPATATTTSASACASPIAQGSDGFRISEQVDVPVLVTWTGQDKIRNEENGW